MSETPLDELSASKAGVSQAELEMAYLSLGTLTEELAEADAAVQEALAEKKVVRAETQAKLRELMEYRDPIKEEWQRAGWIVRNANVDHPNPIGPAPTIRAKRK